MTGVITLKGAEFLALIEPHSTLKRASTHSGGELHGACPFCGGKDRFRVRPNDTKTGKGYWKCRQCDRGGDAGDFVKELNNMTTGEALTALGVKPATNGNGNEHHNGNGGKAHEQREKIETYSYFDERNAHLYDVDRVHIYNAEGKRTDKQFPSYGIIDGKRSKGMEGVRRVLYRLPKLLAADPALPIIFCEGEKLVHYFESLGYVATTLSGGHTANLQDADAEVLRGRELWIVPDGNEVGMQYAKRAASGLYGKAASIKIVRLEIGEKEDAEHWFEAGHTAAEFINRVSDTPRYTPSMNLNYKYITTDQSLAMKPPAFLMSEVLPEGSFTMLYGPSEAGKSFVALDWCASLACVGATVVYALFEGQRTFGKRIAAWQQHNDKTIPPTKLLQLHQTPNLLNDEAFNNLLNDMTVLKPALIVFDTLAYMVAAASLDENSNSDMSKLVSAFNRIQQATGATVLILHHATKDGRWERGAGALRGACDMIVEVSNADSFITVSCSKSKDAAAFKPKRLQLVPVEGSDSAVLIPSDQVTWRADSKLSDNEREALKVLGWETFIEVGAKSGMIAREAHIPEGSIIRVLKTLIRRGMVKPHSTKGEPYYLTDAGKDYLRVNNLS
jgi:KaiC/GvpD/RAD55 family RecA-like ATPase